MPPVPPEPADLGPGSRRIRELVGAFSCAGTRRLLAAQGMTTLLLQDMVGATVRVEVDFLGLLPWTRLEPAARALLPCACDECLVRRSRLLVGGIGRGETVSRNTVALCTCADPLLTAVVADPARPIGSALAAAGAPLPRTIVDAGLGAWPTRCGWTACATRAYVVPSVAAHLMYVRESFSPRFVSPETSPARLSDVRGAGAPR